MDAIHHLPWGHLTVATRPIGVSRPRILTETQLEQIQAGALEIATRLGIAVRHEETLRLAARAGLRVESTRVHPDRSQLAELMAPGEYADEGDERQPESVLTLTPCHYPTHVHDLDTEQLVPFTAERLAESAKLVDSLSDRGVHGGAPGCPQGMPTELQPIIQYRIQAQYCRHGRDPVDPRGPRALPYIMAMAEALGSPLRSLPVHVVSPLTLGGESLDCVMAVRRRLERVYVSNMSSVGATAPVQVCDALALGVAEVICAAAVIRAVTELPVSWSVSMVPFDLRGMAISYGGPEMLLFRWACEEVLAYLQGRTLGPPAGIMRTQAKLPGPQATAEKMVVMVADALMGTRYFSGAGVLSFDEVFSGEQLVLDCEMRDHVQRLIGGIEGECDPMTCVAEVAAGIGSGFLQLDSTLSEYREVYWLPRVWERRSLGAWQGAGSPDVGARAKEMAREYIKEHDYRVDPTIGAELDRICARAEQEFGRARDGFHGLA